MRKSGILLPVASLPSKYGIGAFSKSAYAFIDQLSKAGQSYWQILPLGPTGYGDSPYQSFSTFAGNPYFIDLQEFIKDGYLTEDECEAFDFGSDEKFIDYEKMYYARFKVLRLVFDKYDLENCDKYHKFVKASRHWLDDYVLYMAVKNSFDGKSWAEWDEDIKLRRPKAMEKYKKKYQKEIKFYQFQQYIFAKQWKKLKSYANKKKIEIIGDIPIYVAFDSSDAWANPRLFQFDSECIPTGVAGCPPDAFSTTGQLWGNPLYDWKYHKKTEYKWWIERIRHCFKLYDVVRIDHFRGFDEYYAIPYGDLTAEHGAWKKGPGYDIFREIKKQLGNKSVIAEDLGFLTPSVLKLVKKSAYPGMKVLQFAFDSREESDYLPHNYEKNCIVYTGTHDNDTMQGWLTTAPQEDVAFSRKYINNERVGDKEAHWDFIRLALASVADTAIVPMQDYLGLGSESRINTPSTLGNNWTFRMSPKAFTDALAKRIKNLNQLYCR